MASISTKFGFSSGGPMNGAQLPIPLSGVSGMWLPHWCSILQEELVTTATRKYYVPFWFPRAGFVYAGLKTRNTNTGDNGDTYRCGVYQASPTTGLPSTLVADLGEVTLTGAAAQRTLATSWTTPYEGMGFLCFHANQAANMQPMGAVNTVSSTAAGLITGLPQINGFGLDNATFNVSPIAALFGAYYVDTAYVAMPSTATAPTAITGKAPAMAVYV